MRLQLCRNVSIRTVYQFCDTDFPARQQATDTRRPGARWGQPGGQQQQSQTLDRASNAQRGGFTLRKHGLQNGAQLREQPSESRQRSGFTLRKQASVSDSNQGEFRLHKHQSSAEQRPGYPLRSTGEARTQPAPSASFMSRKQGSDGASNSEPMDRTYSASGSSRSPDLVSFTVRRPAVLKEVDRRAEPSKPSWGTTAPTARDQDRSWSNSNPGELNNLIAGHTGTRRIKMHDFNHDEEPMRQEMDNPSAEGRGNGTASWREQREHWQHLPDRSHDVHRAIQQSSEPNPTNPDLEQLITDRNERLRQARSGELVGWGSGRSELEEPRNHNESALQSRSQPASQAQDFQPQAQSENRMGRRIARFENVNPRLDRRSIRRNEMKRMNTGGRSSGRAEEEEIDERALLRMEQREKRKAEKAKRKSEAPPTPIVLPQFISIGNLAAALHVRDDAFAQKLEELGFEGFSNDHILDAENAGLIAQELNFEPTIAQADTVVEDLVAAPEPSLEDKDLMLNRPPVITIMGHVDHGKTTLLDYLRKSSVAAGEHGGITQHIGAFTVEMSSGRPITFLDTPGHSAFLEMRQRGANVTDIVILVVAADDSVKPQTLEAIKHAQGAGVPMIVAMSKIDKEDANAERVKRDLAKNGVEVEDFGGDVQAIPVSGKTGQGMEDLEDAAIALADVLDVRADTNGAVEGWVLESKLKPHGRVATVLMKRGTLRPGVILVAGTTFTRVRTLRNEAGQTVLEATPGQPVEVDGWDDTPDAGAEALEAPNMQRVREVCDLRRARLETERLAGTISSTNEQRDAHRAQRAITKEQEQMLKRGDVDEARSAELEAAADLAATNATSRSIQAPFIVRGDVAGSVEAVSAAMLGMGNGEIRARILREEVGAISESDIELASIAKGAIVNFALNVPGEIRRMAEKKEVKIIDGNIIYRITDAVKLHLEDLLPPIKTPRVLGEADIAMVFEYKMKDKGVVPVAGCKVTNGTVEKGKNVKILRFGEVVYDGRYNILHCLIVKLIVARHTLLPQKREEGRR